MLQSIVLGLVDSTSPCALSILLFLVGFLFLTALRKNIIKNSVSFIVALFVTLFVFCEGLLSLNPISFWVIDLIGRILTLILGVYGVTRFFYEKEIFQKIDKHILSFPVAILFAVLLSVRFLFCSPGTAMIAIVGGIYLGSIFLYLFGLISPLVVVSLITYALGAKNEEVIDRVRFLRFIGSIALILTVFVL